MHEALLAFFVPSGPGTYRAQGRAPDGTAFEEQLTRVPGEPGLVAAFFGHDDLQGAGQLGSRPAGPASSAPS